MTDDIQEYMDEIDQEALALQNESGGEEDNSLQSLSQRQIRAKKTAKSAKSTKSTGPAAKFNKENESQNQSKRRAKPKVTAVWMEDDIRELIQEVEQQPCIWDFEDENHKNLTKRGAAWCAIVDELKNRFSETECKAKWINIKNAYTNAKCRMLHTKSGQGTETQPTWKYWHDMNFLTKKEALTNIASVSTLDLAAIETGDSELPNTPSQRPLSCPPAASGTGIANRRRKVSTASESSTTQTSKLIEQAMKSLDSLPPDDEWQIMGNYLASHARSIASTDRVAADHLHRKLVKTVLDYLDELDASKQPQAMTWQSVDDSSMPIGTMQLVPISLPTSIHSRNTRQSVNDVTNGLVISPGNRIDSRP